MDKKNKINDGLSTFYLRLYGIGLMLNNHLDSKEKTQCCHYMGYLFRVATRVLLYEPSRRYVTTYHALWPTRPGAMAETGVVCAILSVG